ncbi:MAG: hypothetical protein NTX49_07570 [Chlamydiae bacterium]|nr:hypothetical protein [Chlamydiota bacterium]
MAIQAGHPEHSPLIPTAQHTTVGSLPGIFNLLTIPFDLIYTAASLLKAIYLGDREGEIDAKFRLSTLPLNALSSLSSLATTIMQIQKILVQIGAQALNFGVSIPFIFAANVVGLFLSVIEIIVESVSIKRQVKFLSGLHLNSLEKIEQFISEKDPRKKKELLIKSCHNLCYSKNVPISKMLKETLAALEMKLLFSDQIDEGAILLAQQALTEASAMILQTDAESLDRKYMQLSPEENQRIKSILKKRYPCSSPVQLLMEKMLLKREWLAVKSNNLSRRVSPWCAKEMSSKLKPLLEQMKSEDPVIKKNACKQVKELLFTAKIQAKKHLYYHIVSLVVFAVYAISMIALISSCPPLIPAVMLGVIGTLSFASYILHAGTIEQKGWKFQASDCVPSLVKKGYGKICKLFSNCMKAKKPSIPDGFFKKTCRLLSGPVARPRYLSYCR